MKQLLQLAQLYNKAVQEEDEIPKEKLVVKRVGKVDPKKHLEQEVQDIMAANITQTLGTMLNTVIF